MMKKMLPPRRYLKLVLLVILLGTFKANAQDGLLKFGILSGLGQANVTFETVSKSEGPFGVHFFLDIAYTPRLSFNVEHFRTATVSPLNSRIGFSGMSTKYYVMSAQPQFYLKSDSIEKTSIIIKGYHPYVGFGAGFAQSSLFKRSAEDTDVSTSGGYLDLKGGLDYPLSGTWGLRSELHLGATLVGSGTVQYYFLNFGFYSFL